MPKLTFAPIVYPKSSYPFPTHGGSESGRNVRLDAQTGRRQADGEATAPHALVPAGWGCSNHARGADLKVIETGTDCAMTRIARVPP